ncbi:kinesin motor domain protein [Ichthyophthirius multifiliis]|uniref:Kinesin motor domain protein n=1 Tax=Ichthyophthirius multifiliis TaxID=5932 RepID=G0QZT4_ICHMU|nr:kinesin motor domain protein [Ichthyophthirius multifiliis]EGR29272.1 kinesin motor domain protein [Ichthyophthirius multifiliis]|eukprot:XP_004030508.1 kinesin motor domain protein [Ichthyophthirius multifiliis]
MYQRNNLRKINQIIKPFLKAELEGLTVYSLYNVSQLLKLELDPFIRLDYFNAKLPSGFPDHPHRGFETVTYIKSGIFLYEDLQGNKANLGAGELQWIIAGKGIVHAEIPASYTENTVGFQFWFNVDSKNKMCDPLYQRFSSQQIPLVESKGAHVKILTGESLGKKGIAQTKNQAIFLDVSLDQNAHFNQLIPKEFQGMAFVYEGSAFFGENKINVELNQGALIEIQDQEILQVIAGEQGTKFILFAAKPIREAIYGQSPFVLDSQKNLDQAYEDYQQGKNGFEGAQEWKSEIQQLILKK